MYFMIMALSELQPNVPSQEPEAPIGHRKLTVWEQSDALLCGLTVDEVREMTPSELARLADMTADMSDILLGS